MQHVSVDLGKFNVSWYAPMNLAALGAWGLLMVATSPRWLPMFPELGIEC